MAEETKHEEETKEPEAKAKKKPGEGILARFAYKDGVFSKTAFFHSIATFLVLVTYAAQAWFVGMAIKLGCDGKGAEQHCSIDWTVPAFDMAAAASLIAIVGGTYLANNTLKAKKA